MSARRLVVLVVASTVALGGLVGCTSTTSGSGQAASVPNSAAPGSSGSPGTASGATPGAPTSPRTSGTPVPVPEGRLSVTGTSSQVTYAVTVWDSDDIADCSTHAYGTAMIRFLGAHPCRGAHRVLATVPLDGRTVALSAITTSFPGTPADPYATTAKFVKLEQADGTGAINDLLREGGTLPGAEEIPSSEAFSVLSQDAGVTVFDAWYLSGRTTDQDQKLVALEQDLFLTPFTSA